MGLRMGGYAKVIVALLLLYGLHQMFAIADKTAPQTLPWLWGPIFLVSGALGVWATFVDRKRSFVTWSIALAYAGAMGRFGTLAVEAIGDIVNEDRGDVVAAIGNRTVGGSLAWALIAALTLWAGKEVGETL